LLARRGEATIGAMDKDGAHHLEVGENAEVKFSRALARLKKLGDQK
jgi:hypothetical protein